MWILVKSKTHRSSGIGGRTESTPWVGPCLRHATSRLPTRRGPWSLQYRSYFCADVQPHVVDRTDIRKQIRANFRHEQKLTVLLELPIELNQRHDLVLVFAMLRVDELREIGDRSRGALAQMGKRFIDSDELQDLVPICKMRTMELQQNINRKVWVSNHVLKTHHVSSRAKRNHICNFN